MRDARGKPVAMGRVLVGKRTFFPLPPSFFPLLTAATHARPSFSAEEY